MTQAARASEEQKRPEPRAPRNRAWRRFRRNRAARASGWFLTASIFLILLTLPFSWAWFNVQDVHHAVRAEPTIGRVVNYDAYENALGDNPLGQHVKWLGPLMHRAAAWFGYDGVGRSLFYRSLFGWLVSLGIGLAAATLAVTFGVTWGAVAAMAGGRVDTIMMRIVDVLFGLPYILLVIIFKTGLEGPLTRAFGDRALVANIVILFLAIGAVSWLTMARVIRGQVLSLREQPFIEAARAAGIGRWRLLRRHLLPNLIGPIVVYATLAVPQAILQESFLSFLGIGVQAPVPSLGRLAAEGVDAVNTFVGFWWLITFPCLILVATLLALNFLGDGLRDAFDPKSSAAPMLT